MATPTNDGNDWMVVSRSTQRKVAKRRYGKPLNTDNNTNTNATTKEEAETEPTQVHSQISSCSENLRKSQFYATMGQSWKSFLQDFQKENDDEEGIIKVNEIVCYGIGNFAQRLSHCSGPLWQLALALELQKLIISDHPSSINNRTTPMVYYDPLLTPVERQVLQDYQIQVLATNEKGIRSCRPSSDQQSDNSNDNSELIPISTSTTLFFMPHCPKGLYENVLWANWEELQKNPRSICIVGNSLATYVERATTTTTSSSPSCLELVQPFLREQVVAYSKKDVRDMPGYFEAAFNDTYLTWFDHQNSTASGSMSSADHNEAAETLTLWPKRPDQPSQDGQNEVL